MAENFFDIIKPVTDAERAEYPGMVTPTFLRNLAGGLENRNSGAEDLARCIALTILGQQTPKEPPTGSSAASPSSRESSHERQ